MSSTPIYDELAAILLADQPGGTNEPGRPAATESAEDASAPARSGGRRRKPEPDV